MNPSTLSSLWLILQAEKVTVLAIEGGSVSGPTAHQVADKLRLHGVAAEARVEPNSMGTVGETLSHQASALSANLLVKGAYTQNRLRQMIFGGPTRHIIAHSDVPIFMAR